MHKCQTLGMDSSPLKDIKDSSDVKDGERDMLTTNLRQELNRRLAEFKNNPAIGDTWGNVKKKILS